MGHSRVHSGRAQHGVHRVDQRVRRLVWLTEQVVRCRTVSGRLRAEAELCDQLAAAPVGHQVRTVPSDAPGCPATRAAAR